VKVLVAIDSQDFFSMIFEFLNFNLDMTFVLENLPEDVEGATVSFREKNYKVLPVSSLKNFSANEIYDYIFVFVSKDSKMKMLLRDFGIEKSKIIDFSFITEQIFYQKALLLKQIEQRIDEVNLLVLGNGSAFNSLNLNEFSIPAASLAAQYQDLYFNYLYLKKILSLPQNKIKYVLFGLSPYSFRFDLSKSKYKDRTFSYYPVFQDTHNFSADKNIVSEIFGDIFLQLYDSAEFLGIVQKNAITDFNDPFGLRKKNNSTIQPIDLLGLRVTAKKYLQNNDESIFQENVKIFTDCIELCLKNNVMPVVFISPVAGEYRKYFPEKIFYEFKNTLLKLQEKYQFKILDYWDLNIFYGVEFSKVDELNLEGAKKFTPYVANFIDKLERKKIRLAFTMQITASWTKIIPLYQKMCESKKFDLYGIVCPSDPEAVAKIKTGEPLTLKYGAERDYFHNLYDNDRNITLIDATNGHGMFDPKAYHFDYVFYLQPYDYNFHPPFKCAEVSKFAKTFHILYGIMTTDNFLGFYLQFSDFYNAVNFYFTECEHAAEIFGGCYKTAETDGKQQFIFRGLPEVEQLCKENEKTFYLNLEKPRKSVIWTPRWSNHQNIGGSHFLEYKDNFMSLRQKYPELKIFMRPHPGLFDNMKKEKFMTEEDIEQYKNALKLNDIWLDETPTYTKAMKDSDIMITDVTSIMIDFFLTGKPMIYCPSGNRLYGDCELMESAMYLSGEDPLKDERRRAFEILCERHKNASERIMNTLIEDYNSQTIKF